MRSIGRRWENSKRRSNTCKTNPRPRPDRDRSRGKAFVAGADIRDLPDMRRVEAARLSAARTETPSAGWS